MTVNQMLQQQGISHAVYLERLKTHEVRRVVTFLNQMDKDLVAQIAKKSGETFTKARLNALLRDVRWLNEQTTQRLAFEVQDGLKDVATYEAGFQAKRLQTTVPIEWNITQPAPNQLLTAVLERPFANALFTDHVKQFSAHRLQQMEGALRMGFAEGQSISDIVRRIRGTRAAHYRDGILEMSRRNIEAMVRTSVTHASATAREQTYRENDDLIKGVQWVATLDGRTTMICAALDGKVFEIGEGPRPPAHWNCRSTTVPVVKSWKELGINVDEAPEGVRASMTGQVPAKTTYGSWLKNQPAAVQRDVLGSTRYRKFRDGAPIDSFVKDGRVMTIDELGRRESIAE